MVVGAPVVVGASDVVEASAVVGTELVVAPVVPVLLVAVLVVAPVVPVLLALVPVVAPSCRCSLWWCAVLALVVVVAGLAVVVVGFGRGGGGLYVAARSAVARLRIARLTRSGDRRSNICPAGEPDGQRSNKR